MSVTPQFDGENTSNHLRDAIRATEPVGQRTLTPTQMVIDKAAGVFVYTPEGRALFDFTSGVLVTNLGHHPRGWLQRFRKYLDWSDAAVDLCDDDFVPMTPWTTYNAISPLESQANQRLLASLRTTPNGARMEKVLWAASGSEAIQKALWSCLKFTAGRTTILATRDGFHGKKGLAGAVTGNEQSAERDPRVRFVAFPKEECLDVSLRDQPFDARDYDEELERVFTECQGGVSCLITEPYLGGAGSYHPPREYLPILQTFCRKHDIALVLDEVQSNFGRTGEMYAFEKYGIEPDLVVLGKGLGNGVPVNCVAGRADILEALAAGEASDTWSHNPLGCAAVLATLDLFEENVPFPSTTSAPSGVKSRALLEHAREVSTQLEAGLCKLKQLAIVKHIRGEGMVWGIELKEFGSRSSHEIAIECIRQAYLGDENGRAIHILGPLAQKVLRIAPPLTITASQLREALDTMYTCFERVTKV